MRTTISLDDEVHGLVTYYARARGLTLSAAISELIRKGEKAPEPPADIRRTPAGFPIFPPADARPSLTDEDVRTLDQEEFDPQASS